MTYDEIIIFYIYEISILHYYIQLIRYVKFKLHIYTINKLTFFKPIL